MCVCISECWVTISLDSLHHNPDFWPNPDLYDPSRFASENIKDRPSHAFLAFSAGPRQAVTFYYDIGLHFFGITDVIFPFMHLMNSQNYV